VIGISRAAGDGNPKVRRGLSSALPAAGGGYTFARRALGPWGGFATGTAILIEYSIAQAGIATFIGAYVESPDRRRRGALKAMFVITAIALVRAGGSAASSCWWGSGRACPRRTASGSTSRSTRGEVAGTRNGTALSNIRPPHGTGYEAAATTLAMLMAEAGRLGLSGVALKADPALEA
jgi:amino acid transporter